MLEALHPKKDVRCKYKPSLARLLGYQTCLCGNMTGSKGPPASSHVAIASTSLTSVYPYKMYVADTS
jgi:hypothetical protein